MKHPNDMTNEEFCSQYIGWIRTCVRKVASKYPHVNPRELLGEAYLTARYSARFWCPKKKADFLTYSKKLILGKLAFMIWKELGSSRPLPSEVSVKDPGTCAIPLHSDVLGIVYDSIDCEVSSQLEELKAGSDLLYTASPLDLLIYKRALETIDKQLKEAEATDGEKIKGTDKVKILEQVWFFNESQREIAKNLNVSHEAVCLVVRKNKKELRQTL